MLYYKKISSPLGEITLRSDGESLTGLWFADDKHYGDKDIQDAQNAELPVFARAEKWLAEYFVPMRQQDNTFYSYKNSFITLCPLSVQLIYSYLPFLSLTNAPCATYRRHSR